MNANAAQLDNRDDDRAWAETYLAEWRETNDPARVAWALECALGAHGLLSEQAGPRDVCTTFDPSLRIGVYGTTVEITVTERYGLSAEQPEVRVLSIEHAARMTQRLIDAPEAWAAEVNQLIGEG